MRYHQSAVLQFLRLQQLAVISTVEPKSNKPESAMIEMSSFA